MIIIITGPENSGKSKYAEDIIRRDYCNCKGYYIATMIPYGDFGKEKIEKHRNMRKDLNLITIEDPYLERLSNIEVGTVVLLEDLSNLIANYRFNRHASIEAINEVLDEVIDIGRERTLIIVAPIFRDYSEYDNETKEYIKIISEGINYIIDHSHNMVCETINL